jgi:hypothetical protein
MTQPRSRLSGGALSDTAGVARDHDAGAMTFTSLPRDLFDDPFDLARLSRVSREMRAAVKATGCELKELNAYRAAKLGYLNMLRHMDSRGRLPKTRKVLLCMAAARSGQLEELKALRAKRCPWNESTCTYAAGRRPPRGAEVGARERLPVGRVDVRGARRRTAISRC